MGNSNWLPTVGSGNGFERASTPADALLAADAGAFLTLGQNVAVAGVGIAPAEIGVQGPGLHGVVGAGRLQSLLIFGRCRSGQPEEVQRSAEAVV